jgi:hypothetical protein
MIANRVATEEAGAPRERNEAPPSLARRLRSWFAGMRFQADSPRDLRIDFLRGVAIVVMVSNHLAARSYINAFTQGRVYVSAAEGFVFLAGYVLGAVSVARAARDGVRSANAQLFTRAFTLFKTWFVMVALAAGITWLRPGLASPIFDELPAPVWRVTLAAGMFHVEPRILDILQLYVLCIGASPAILWFFSRGYVLAVVVASVSLWGINQMDPYALCFSPVGREHPYFAFPSWQLLYVIGLVLGYHAKTLKKFSSRTPRWLIIGLGVPIITAAAVAAHYDVDLGVWPTRVLDRARWIALTDRSLLGGVRIVALCALFPTMLVVVDTFWRPLRSALGDVLLTLGQNSLYVFLVHVPFVVAWHLFPAVSGNPTYATVGQLVVLALLWQLAKRKVLFDFIPR